MRMDSPENDGNDLCTICSFSDGFDLQKCIIDDSVMRLCESASEWVKGLRQSLAFNLPGGKFLIFHRLSKESIIFLDLFKFLFGNELPDRKKFLSNLPTVVFNLRNKFSKDIKLSSSIYEHDRIMVYEIDFFVADGRLVSLVYTKRNEKIGCLKTVVNFASMEQKIIEGKCFVTNRSVFPCYLIIGDKEYEYSKEFKIQQTEKGILLWEVYLKKIKTVSLWWRFCHTILHGFSSRVYGIRSISNRPI